MQSININGNQLFYIITRKSVKNINMRVKNDGIIHISANKSVPEKYIEALIEKNSQKFIKAINHLQNQKNYDSDISFVKYLGNKYAVQIISSNEEKAVFDKKCFSVYTSETDNKEKILFLILKWKSEHSMNIFADMNIKVCNEFRNAGYNVPLSVITVKLMKSRWGSCNYVKGRFSINLRLIDYPIECIYAVFCHEYMHYIHQNHSAKFYSALEKICPLYKKYDKMLK